MNVLAQNSMCSWTKGSVLKHVTARVLALSALQLCTWGKPRFPSGFQQLAK